MSTIEKITEKSTLESELAVFWDEIAQGLPKSLEREALGDEKIFTAFRAAYPKIRKQLLTQHKEEAIKRLEGKKKVANKADEDGYRTAVKKNRGYNQALEEEINHLKDN